jgi:DNA-binding MarR family transcriptional regulator
MAPDKRTSAQAAARAVGEEELAQVLRLAVTRLARRLRQEADTGATLSMLSALATISRSAPITLGELAAAERIQPPSITAVVARLEEAGLVVRRVDDSDRRVFRLEPTPAGTRLLERSRSRKNAFLATRLRRLTGDERSTLSAAAELLDHLLGDES